MPISFAVTTPLEENIHSVGVGQIVRARRSTIHANRIHSKNANEIDRSQKCIHKYIIIIIIISSYAHTVYYYYRFFENPMHNSYFYPKEKTIFCTHSEFMAYRQRYTN